MAKTKKTNPKAEPAAGTGYPPIIERTWAAWESLRRLGFASEDIYVIRANEDRAKNDKGKIFVSLHRAGREFNIEIDRLGAMSADRFIELWTRFSEELNAGKFSLDLMNPIFFRWLGEVGGGTAVVTAIVAKGFVLPRAAAAADA